MNTLKRLWSLNKANFILLIFSIFMLLFMFVNSVLQLVNLPYLVGIDSYILGAFHLIIIILVPISWESYRKTQKALNKRQEELRKVMQDYAKKLQETNPSWTIPDPPTFNNGKNMVAMGSLYLMVLIVNIFSFVLEFI